MGNKDRADKEMASRLVKEVERRLRKGKNPDQFLLDLANFLSDPGKAKRLEEQLLGPENDIGTVTDEERAETKSGQSLKKGNDSTPVPVPVSLPQLQIPDLPEVDPNVLRNFDFCIAEHEYHFVEYWKTFEELGWNEELRKKFAENIEKVRIGYNVFSQSYPQIKFALAKLEELLFRVDPVATIEPEAPKPVETMATSEASAPETKSAPEVKLEAKAAAPAKDPVKELDPDKVYFAVGADWYSLDEIMADAAVKGLFQKAFADFEKGFVRVRKNRFAANVAVKDSKLAHLPEDLKEEYRKLRVVFLGPEAVVATELAKTDAIDPEAEAAVAVLVEEPAAKPAEVKSRPEIKYSTCKYSETFVRLSDIDEESLLCFSDYLERRLPIWVSVDGVFYEMSHLSVGYANWNVSDYNLKQRLEQYVRELAVFVTTRRKLAEAARATKLVEMVAAKPAEVSHDPQAKPKLEPLSDEEIEAAGRCVKYSISFLHGHTLKDIRSDSRIRQEFREYCTVGWPVFISADGLSAEAGEVNNGSLTEETYRKFRGYLHLLDRLLFATDCGDEKKPEKQDHPKSDEKSQAGASMSKPKVLYGLFGYYLGHSNQLLDEIRYSKDLCERYRKAFVEHVNIKVEVGRDMFTMGYDGGGYAPYMSGYRIDRATLIKYLDELWEVVFECEGISIPSICQHGGNIGGRWVAESNIQKYPRLQEAQKAEMERECFDKPRYQTGSFSTSKDDAPYPMGDIDDLDLPK